MGLDRAECRANSLHSRMSQAPIRISDGQGRKRCAARGKQHKGVAYACRFATQISLRHGFTQVVAARSLILANSYGTFQKSTSGKVTKGDTVKPLYMVYCCPEMLSHCYSDREIYLDLRLHSANLTCAIYVKRSHVCSGLRLDIAGPSLARRFGGFTCLRGYSTSSALNQD